MNSEERIVKLESALQQIANMNIRGSYARNLIRCQDIASKALTGVRKYKHISQIRKVTKNSIS